MPYSNSNYSETVFQIVKYKQMVFAARNDEGKQSLQTKLEVAVLFFDSFLDIR